jgi:hypothetical protein
MGAILGFRINTARVFFPFSERQNVKEKGLKIELKWEILENTTLFSITSRDITILSK